MVLEKSETILLQKSVDFLRAYFNDGLEQEQLLRATKKYWQDGQIKHKTKETLQIYVLDEVLQRLIEIEDFCLTKNFTRGDANLEQVKILSDR